MLYTTYFSKINDIPGEDIKLIITRFPPKWLDYKTIPNTHLIQSLAPSKELLLDYKNNNNWSNYVKQFKKEMVNMQHDLNRIEETLKINKNVYLICYEKDDNFCHRSILRDYFKDLGYQCKEF